VKKVKKVKLKGLRKTSIDAICYMKNKTISEFQKKTQQQQQQQAQIQQPFQLLSNRKVVKVKIVFHNKNKN